MSLITKRGDHGETDLLFGKKAKKTDDRIEALGAVDELNTALGVVRTGVAEGPAKDWINEAQKNLVSLMGELATLPEDAERYDKAGYGRVPESAVEELEKWVAEAEQEHPMKGWARPGQAGEMAGAWADMARTICRRAERSVWAVCPEGGRINLYLNRLADALWALARQLEKGA